METVIKVNGMMCSHCKATVEKVCKAVPGTVDAVVDLAANTVTVTGSADVAALKKAITDADYEVVEESEAGTVVIRVNGMMCSHCKATVEQVCKAVPGTVDAVVDLAAKTVTVTGSADTAALKQAIRDADYEVVEE